MSGYDVKKALKAFYAPKNGEWALVDVPPMRFIGVDGAGDPNSAAAYAEAVEALYQVAYTLKFAHRDRPFTVGPLEGLWWAEDPTTFVTRKKAAWRWTMLISLPPGFTDDEIDAAKAAALEKKKRPAISRVRVVALSEGRCAQVLHTGPYDDEGPKLAELHGAFFAEHGLTFNGLHHEIYLSDPRRVEPAKLKTILRQPVRAASAGQGDPGLGARA